MSETRKANGIHGRGLTSLTALTSFLIMTITGIVLYFAPQGRVAYWVFWEFIGLSKTDWGNIHIISSIVFAVAGGFHIYFNWKPLINYLSGKIAGSLKYGKELAAASVLSVIIIAGSIYLFPPFNYVIEFSEYLKNAWVYSKEYEPPFGHAEQTSLRTFTKRMDIDLKKAEAELKAEGIKFHSAKDRLEDIAAANHITPMDIYVVIKKHEKKPAADENITFTPELVDEKFAGTGLGRKALSWVIEDTGIPPELANQRLAQNNIEADGNETLKEIASRYEIDPIEILKVMLVENYAIKEK
jgi:hypothetical protein